MSEGAGIAIGALVWWSVCAVLKWRARRSPRGRLGRVVRRVDGYLGATEEV